MRIGINGRNRQRRVPVQHIPTHNDRQLHICGHPQTLRLLSFNIQVGIHTAAPHHYLTRGWQHLLPHPGRDLTLKDIAFLIQDYDVVALQEVDGGSYRSGYTNQVHYLANSGRFPYWYQQLNRNLGMVAQHSNGLLSRIAPSRVEDHRLPGLMPGRGAICFQFGQGDQALLLINLHLSLGRRSRVRQLNYLRQLIGDHRRVVIMGDLNCHHDVILNHAELHDVPLQPPEAHQLTFPSWRPSQALDHILVSDSLEVIRSEVLDITISDHRPVAVELQLAPDH